MVGGKRGINKTRQTMKKEIKLLKLDYDLKSISEQDLAIIMMEACAVYNECRHGIPKSANDAWIRVEHVAKEIGRRRHMETLRKHNIGHNGEINNNE